MILKKRLKTIFSQYISFGQSIMFSRISKEVQLWQFYSSTDTSLEFIQLKFLLFLSVIFVISSNCFQSDHYFHFNSKEVFRKDKNNQRMPKTILCVCFKTQLRENLNLVKTLIFFSKANQIKSRFLSTTTTKNDFFTTNQKPIFFLLLHT